LIDIWAIFDDQDIIRDLMWYTLPITKIEYSFIMYILRSYMLMVR